jgi:hypothetical protein
MIETNTQSTALQRAESNQQVVLAGFGDSASFAHLQRVATMFSRSAIVPEMYRGEVGLPNCVIALEMAQRMAMSPLAVMQHTYVVYGKPGWDSTFIIACVNSCGRYSPLRFDLKPAGEKTLEYEHTKYVNGQKQREKGTITVQDIVCIAWAVEKSTNTRLESPPVSIEMSVKEGWYTKTDSKWRTMPELMLRYRTATLFGRIYAPELLMGMRPADELTDIIEVESEVRRVEPERAATIKITRTPATAPEVKAQAAPAAPLEEDDVPFDSPKSATVAATTAPAQTPEPTAQSSQAVNSSAPVAPAQAPNNLPNMTEAKGIIESALELHEIPFDDFLRWLGSAGYHADPTAFASMADLPDKLADTLVTVNKRTQKSPIQNCITLYGKPVTNP